jgi:uncharacterized protein YndB with AHSA1/START domain
MDGTLEAKAIEREVRSEERQGAPARVVVAQREFAAPIEDVWDAVTNPERLPRWFLPVTGDLSVGGRYQFVGNAGGEVLACERPDRAELTWEYGGEVSWLELRLSEVPGGTRLHLEHVAHVTPERWTEFGPGAVGVGWDLSIVGLGHHLAGGPDFTEVEKAEFHTTAEGRSFIETSSAAWSEAAIEGGDERAAATAAGERTAAAYTGTG